MSKNNSLTIKDYPFVALRLAMGWLFFYAGITKVLNPSWTSAGYLKNAQTFSDFYSWLASTFNIGWVDFLNQWGLTLIGLALIFGVYVRWASYGGIAMMLLYYFPILSFPLVGEHSFLIDEHIIYSLSLWLIQVSGAGEVLSIENRLKSLDFKKIGSAFIPVKNLKNNSSNKTTNEVKSKKNQNKNWLDMSLPTSGSKFAKNLLLIAISSYAGLKILFPLLETIVSKSEISSDLVLLLLSIILLLILVYLVSRMLLYLVNIMRSKKLGLVFLILLVAFVLMFASTEYHAQGSTYCSSSTYYTYGGWPVETILVNSSDPLTCSISKLGPVVNYIFWLTMVTSVYGLITRDFSYWGKKSYEEK
ncbi:MAG: DoxX family protein [bacterium]|nr:DoxX family protein [bacterium]